MDMKPRISTMEEAQRERLTKLVNRTIELFKNAGGVALPHHSALQAAKEMGIDVILDGVGSRVWDERDDEWYWENGDGDMVVELERGGMSATLEWVGDNSLRLSK